MSLTDHHVSHVVGPLLRDGEWLVILRSSPSNGRVVSVDAELDYATKEAALRAVGTFRRLLAGNHIYVYPKGG